WRSTPLGDCAIKPRVINGAASAAVPKVLRNERRVNERHFINATDQKTSERSTQKAIWLRSQAPLAWLRERSPEMFGREGTQRSQRKALHSIYQGPSLQSLRSFA